MKRRFGRRRSDRMIALWAIVATVALFVTYEMACDTNGPTAPPLPVTESVAPVVASSTPAPAATPASTPTPERARGPVSVVCQGGACKFSNTEGATHVVLAECTKAGLHNDWGSISVKVPHGTDTASVTPYDVCDVAKMGVSKLRCADETRNVQLDFTAGQGEHIGHLITLLTYAANSDDGWVEQRPVVTYGEWGECAPVAAPSGVGSRTAEGQCQRSRSKTTVVSEVNSCTEKTREKSRVVETVSEPCTCPCVSRQIEQDPIRENETPYGACEPGGIISNTTTPPTVDCPGHKSRTVDIVIYQIDSCTQVRTEKSRINIEEQAPCTAQCEQAFCHTENFSIILGFRWKCQNVPPGTPGHWPHHFDDFPHHNDFFGPCTVNRCYSITN